MAETKRISLRFRTDFKSPTLQIGHADYRRTFKSSEQPFSATQDEYDAHLAREGVFEIVTETVPVPLVEEKKVVGGQGSVVSQEKEAKPAEVTTKA